MAMEISGSTNLAAQGMGASKAETGHEFLTQSGDKTEQMRNYEQQRLEIAEQTGKGLNLDVRA